MKLKVLSMNIHKGFSIFDRSFTLPQVQKALAAADLDVVFLQEVVGENLILKEQISDWPKTTQSAFLAGDHFPHHSYGRNANYFQRHHGNAILSRFPITFSENISLKIYQMEQRGLLHCKIQIPGFGQPVHLFNVHLDLTNLTRQRQIQKIILRGKSHVPQNEPLILAGDFNDWARKASAHFQNSLQLQEAAKTHKGDYHRSFPSFYPLLKLDRMYFRHLKLLSTETWDHDPWPEFSDHLPILSEFDLGP